MPVILKLVEETRDCSRANAIINHESCRDGLSLGLTGEMDLAPLLENPDNLLFCGDHGGALLHWNAPGVYDIHDFVLPSGRGRWAITAAHQIFDAMTDKGARLIWCWTPIANRASCMFNRMLGFKSEGVSMRTLGPGLAPMEVETFVREL